MGNIAELASYFPGSRVEKKSVGLHIKRNEVTIQFDDGTETTMNEPVQIQDFPVPEKLVEPWFNALRKADSSITRYSYREKSYLKNILNSIK